MTHEQLTAFIIYAKGDLSLQEKLKVAADVDAVAAITQEAGFRISADDWKKAQPEISEKELEGVAGSVGSNGGKFWSFACNPWEEHNA